MADKTGIEWTEATLVAAQAGAALGNPLEQKLGRLDAFPRHPLPNILVTFRAVAADTGRHDVIGGRFATPLDWDDVIPCLGRARTVSAATVEIFQKILSTYLRNRLDAPLSESSVCAPPISKCSGARVASAHFCVGVGAADSSPYVGCGRPSVAHSAPRHSVNAHFQALAERRARRSPITATFGADVREPASPRRVTDKGGHRLQVATRAAPSRCILKEVHHG